MAWRGPTNKKVITNKEPNKVNFGPEMSDMKKPVASINGPAEFGPNYNPNRAFNVRRDNDTQKDFSVKLIDIDTTILSYLDTVICPSIIDAGRKIKVPINYASPEKWKAIRKDGALRDKNGKIQCPAIAFRRSTMQRNDGLITFNKYLQYPVVKKFSEKNKYDKFSVMNGFNHRKEMYSVAMPDHVIVNYEFIVWTDLIEQGNSIIEDINFSTEDYWGDKNRYKFRTSISDYNFETTNDAGQDRIVKTTFSLMVYAYLLPEKFENYKSTVQKAFTIRKVVFNSEAVSDLNGINVEEIKKKVEQSYGERRLPPFNLFDYAKKADAAEFSTFSVSASFASTASFVDLSATGSTTLGDLTLVSGSAAGSFGTGISTGVSSPTTIDTVPITVGNAAMWLVSINDGTNYRTNEVVAGWNNTDVNYYVTEVSAIGSVPVILSVSNNGSGGIVLGANPAAGTWTIKMIRMVV